MPPKSTSTKAMKSPRRYVRAYANPLAIALDGTPAQRKVYVSMRRRERAAGKRQFGEDARLWLFPQIEEPEAYRDWWGFALIQQIAEQLDALHILQRAFDSVFVTNA